MPERIKGKKVILRPATMSDRRPIYEWLANSDLTHKMLGPPDFPDAPIPTWEEFLKDYAEYFFDSSQPRLGRCFIIEVDNDPIGQINHDVISEDNRTELDIWLKSSKYIGKGYGTDAIKTLCIFLKENLSCINFRIAPSRRNKAAIKAYEKAGFVESREIPEGYSWDYEDGVLMVMTL